MKISDNFTELHITLVQVDVFLNSHSLERFEQGPGSNKVLLYLNDLFKQINNCNADNFPNVLYGKLNQLFVDYIQIVTALINNQNIQFTDQVNRQVFQELINNLLAFNENFFSLNVRNTKYPAAVSGYFICSEILRLNFESEMNELMIIKSQISSSIIKYDDLISELQKKSAEEVTKNYAQMFEDDAILNKKSGDNWLYVIAFTILAFLIFIYFEDILTPLDYKGSSSILTLSYVKRLLVVSFFLYIITFFAKQYSIKMHLHTLNKHRKNTLNSYKLFMQSISNEDTDARNALMKEVAKSIYEAGQTGYINIKDNAENNTLLTEITKVIRNNPTGT
jgi:hypothetical protein